MNFIKIAGLVMITILITNLILFALHKIPPLVFWLIIILGAITAYLPRLIKRVS